MAGGFLDNSDQANALAYHDLTNEGPSRFSRGGYAQKFDPKKGWIQLTGARAALTLRGPHAAQGTRRERRARGWQKWARSRHTFRS